MRGIWLRKSDAEIATGKTRYFFQKDLMPYLKTRKRGTKANSWLDVFLPEKYMLPAYKEMYKDMMTEDEDEQAEEVEEVLGDLTKLGEVEYTDPGSALVAARLDNLKARTAFINEKLVQRKQELFWEWSERFFNVFSDSFTRFKNALIDMHLSEEQLAVLTSKLELALKSMEDKLQQINDQWLNEDVEDKDDKA